MKGSDATLGLATPERVALELPIAGVGTRALAWLVDAGLLAAVAFTLYFGLTLAVDDPLDAALGLSGGVRAAWAAGLFLALWGYWTALEVLWQGQTVGKRLLEVRVVRADGTPVTALDSAVRNLMRVVDFLPACYPVGIVTMLVDPRHRRLGDLVAGTVLVREEVVDLAQYLPAEGAAQGRALDPEALELVGGYLGRFDALEPAARLRLGRALLERLGLGEGPAPGEDAVRARLEAAARQGGGSALGLLVAGGRAGWLELEALLADQRRRPLDLEELQRLDRGYRRASADLARAAARFPGTAVHRFLNRLCGRAHAAIYRPPLAPGRALGRFFARGFPRAVRATLPYAGLAFGLLGLGAALGAAAVALQPGGLALLVDTPVRDFLERRELWTDQALQLHAPAGLATLIFVNNLEVALTAFGLGVTGGVGTALVAVWNGLQLGAIGAGCARAGLLPGLLDFLAAHGPLELSLLSLTSGAGLVVGHALLDPGERGRAAWVKERAALAVQVVLGCAPFLVATGVVEAFVSPGPLFPWPLKALAGAAACAGFWRYALRRPPAPAP